MTLTQKQRSALYEHFAPDLGDELTEAFLDQFPKGSGDEPVTREYLDLRLAAMEGALVGRIGSGMGRLTSVILGAASLIIASIAVATSIVVAAN